MSDTSGRDALPRAALYFLALLATAYTLHLAREMLLPLTLAVIFALLLTPLVTRMQTWRIPRPVSSLLLIASMLGVAGVGVAALSSSAMEWLQRVPEASEILMRELASMEREVSRMDDAGKSIDALTREIGVDDDSNGEQKVIIAEPGWRAELWVGMRNFAVFGGLSIILLFFLLSAGDQLVKRCAETFKDEKDRLRALRVARDAQLQMSRYLVTIAAVNTLLGLIVTLALWLLDFPDPALWGTMAAALRFVPYLGVSLTVAMLAVVGMVSYDTVWMMLTVPLGYLLFTSFVGQIIDPLVHGYRLRLDPIVVFVWIFFWGWIWGAPGVLLAVPLLTLLQVVCRHSTRLAPLAHILGDR
ncbi:MAG: AI-2E family transporter [Oceanococcus sp.]|nr:MAG: AI-2E family transporter [Oceanococcus sp.]